MLHRPLVLLVAALVVFQQVDSCISFLGGGGGGGLPFFGDYGQYPDADYGPACIPHECMDFCRWKGTRTGICTYDRCDCFV